MLVGVLCPVNSRQQKLRIEDMCLLLLETRVLIDTPALFLVIFRVDKPEF